MSFADYMPEALRRLGPFDVELWQWLGIVFLLLAAWVIGRLGAAVIVFAGSKLAGRTTTSMDDELLARLKSPVRTLASVVLTRIGVPFLDLPARAESMTINVLLALFALALVWAALRAIEVMASHLSSARWADRPSSRSLLALVSRIAKVLVVVIAGIGFLSGLGLPVASLLAGLGIGGIALAFGAQKTVENLFGAIAIGVDQPFREGDFVRVEADVTGTIEFVGLRSTRIRTLDRTIVSLPNGRLADMRIETYALRDRIRLHTTLNIVYGTTAAQMREVLAGFERVLREHAGIWQDEVTVRFVAFGASSLDIEIMCWFQTTDINVFRPWRQDVLLGFMDVVERAGTSFAFPTRTIHVVNEPTQKAS